MFAAASLTDAFTALGGAELVLGGSSSLATQLREGAPADVFASADEGTMQGLVDYGIVEAPVPFARNRLAIAVEPGNPRGITGLADLARGDLVVVLCDPSVPAGAYAREALARAGVEVRPSSLELDVKAALAKVTTGEADAALVYATDTEHRVDLPPEHDVLATYPIAVVRGSERGQAFVDRVLAERGQRTLRDHGFLPAP